MKKSQSNMKLSALVHAEWNPRSSEEMSTDNPEMQQLIASVREHGILQPIAVWSTSSSNIVIAGNRRFEAARHLAIKTIPAIVFEDITLAQAKEITRAENEVRLGVSPIKDAELIASMLSLGYRQNEIAAHFGVPEAKICRRAKLISLIAPIRDIASSISTAALERIASFDERVQSECANLVASAAKKNSGARLRWSDIAWNFASFTKDLDAAPFQTERCAACSNRTGAQPDLWGNELKPGRLGQCLNCKCFDALCDQHFLSLVRSKVGDATELVRIKDAPIPRWQMDWDEWSDFFGPKRSKKRTVAYWDHSTSGELDILFGVPLDAINAEIKRRSDQQAAEEEKRREEEERNAAANAARKAVLAERDRIAAARRDAFSKLDENWRDAEADETLRREIVKALKPNKFAKLVAEAAVAGSDDWSFQSDHPDWSVLFADAFPSVALCLDANLVEAARSADKALANFDRDNNIED